MIYYILIVLTVGLAVSLLIGFLNIWIVFWVIGSLIIGAIPTYYMFGSLSLGRKISILALAISLITGWYIYLPAGLEEKPEKVSATQEVKDPVGILDSFSLEIQRDALISLTENLKEEISDPEMAAEKLNIAAEKVSTLAKAKDNFNQEKNKLSNYSLTKWSRLMTDWSDWQFKLPEVNVKNCIENIGQASNVTKFLILGFSLLFLSLFIRRVPKEKKTMASSVGALLVLLAALMMLWPGIAGLPAQAAGSVSQVWQSRPVAVSAPQEEWRTIFSANLSPDEWSEEMIFPLTANKWKILKTGDVKVESLGKIHLLPKGKDVTLPREWTEKRSPLKFKGDGRIEVLVK